MHLRGGKKFKDEPAYQWHIYGEKGEIRIVSPGPFVNFYDPNVTIRVHDQEKDTVEEVAWDEPSLVSGLPSPAQNVARMYEAWAAGGSVPDFEAALRRHKMLDAVRASSDKGSRVSYV